MYHCEICDYHTERKPNHKRHMESAKHLKKVNGPVKKVLPITKKYYCELCNIYVKDKYDWTRHKNTDRHCAKNGAESEAAVAALGRFPTNDEKTAARLLVKRKAKTKFKKPIHHSSRSKSKSNDGSDEGDEPAEPVEPVKPVNKRTMVNLVINRDDYPEYLTLSASECLQKINYFIKFLKSRSADIENWVCYSYLNRDDNATIFDLYIEIYELVQDNELYEEIINL